MKNWHALSLDLLGIRWIFLEDWWEVWTRGQPTSWWGCSEHWPCQESDSIFIASKIKQVTWYVSNQWQAYGSLEKLSISRGNGMHYKIFTVLSEDHWKCHPHLQLASIEIALSFSSISQPRVHQFEKSMCPHLHFCHGLFLKTVLLLISIPPG